MTDEPNEGAGTEPGGEEAGDLDAAELEAAASAAEFDVEGEPGPGPEPIGVGADEADAAAEAAAEEAEVAGDETAAYEPDEDEETAPLRRAPARDTGTRRFERPAAGPVGRGPRPPKATRTMFAIDPALRIHDRASAAFVLGSVAVFVLILANALALGQGGAFTPLPTAVPIPTAGPTASPGPSESVTPSASPAASASPAPSTSPAPSMSPAPAASPTGSGTPTASPGGSPAAS